MNDYQKIFKLRLVLLIKLFCFGLVVAFLFYPVNGMAWFGRGGHHSETKVKILGRHDQKKIAKNLVNNLLKQDFFTRVELPRKLVLTQINLEGDDLGTNPEEFTDKILNNLLEHPQIMIMNQDLKIDLSLDYKLMHYLPAVATRKKGILLGADYYIDGFLRSEPITLENGKIQQGYKAALYVNGIRDDKNLCTVEFDLSQKKKHSRKTDHYR